MKIFGFAGFSGAGKTTLIEKLLAVFVGRGMKVSLIKHAHHDFDLDQPGKDSYRHRHAGASEVLVFGAKRWALLHESRNETEPELSEMISRISPCDLLLIEGCKDAGIPKIEVWRKDNGKPHLSDPGIIARVSDVPFDSAVPCFHLHDIEKIAFFMEHYT